jgi:hypothetical protein
MFEKRMLKRILGPNEVTGWRRKLQKEELCNVYSSSNRMIKLRSMNRAENIARMGGKMDSYRL